MPEQCIWTSLLGGDSICDRFGELIDSICQRLADAVAVSRIFDAPYIDIGSPLARTSKNARSEIRSNNGTA